MVRQLISGVAALCCVLNAFGASVVAVEGQNPLASWDPAELAQLRQACPDYKHYSQYRQ